MSNTTTNRYGSLAAEIYDLDKPFGKLPDTAFYLARLEGVRGPVLEPACGSGRTLVPLLEAGFDACGFDLSPDMLAQCRDRCAAKGFAPDLKLQRLEDFSYDRRFAAIVVPVASFTLLDAVGPAMAALKRFRDHLEPGGRLVIDVHPLSALARTGDDRRRWTAANGDLLTLEGVRATTDWIGQRVDYTIRYERWRDNRLVEAQLEPMAQRYWGVEEFRLALAASGFGEITVSADYVHGRPPGAGARVLTYEARAA